MEGVGQRGQKVGEWWGLNLLHHVALCRLFIVQPLRRLEVTCIGLS